MDVALKLLAVVALIVANAFFVAAEYAIVTARRTSLQQRADDGSASARTVLRLMDDPVRVIGAVQVAITGLGILLGAVGEPVFRELAGGVLPSWTAFLVGFAVVTYLSVAFGELVPKAMALHSAERLALLVAPPIDLFARLVAPIVWLLQRTAELVLRPLGVPSVGVGERPLTRDELRGVLQEAEEHGTVAPEEEDMLTGVIELRLRQAGDVMRPWEDVDVARLDAPPLEALDGMLAAAHSRFPAIDGSGAVVGVLHARDVWMAWRDAGDGFPDLRQLVRQTVVVPPTVRVDELLRALRRARQQLAVVVDEYGRTAGIVSLEDILEEIVGEIEDEFDELDARFERVGEHEWLVDGAVSVSDFNRRIGAALVAERARSIGGVVLERLGRLPEQGETVRLDGMRLTVERMKGHRIEAVRAQLR
jgi:putative hemolysin